MVFNCYTKILVYEQYTSKKKTYEIEYWPFHVAVCIVNINPLSNRNESITFPKLEDLTWFLGFGNDWFQSCIGEVAFGVGAESMAASKPHTVVAPTQQKIVGIQFCMGFLFVYFSYTKIVE